MNESLSINKRIINKEQCQQILEMVDSVGLDKKQISEKLEKIIGEPQNDKEAAENYWMTEIICKEISKSGSMAYSEIPQRERMLDEIQQTITECCRLKVKLFEILENRKRWEANEVIIVSECPKRTLAKFRLLEEANKKLCLSCQELKAKLIEFVNSFWKDE